MGSVTMASHDFVVHLRDLKRTQGARKEFSLQGGLDEDISTGLIHLPKASPIHVEGWLESVGDGVLVTATVSAEIDAQCSRCLTDFAHTTEVDIQELFVYPDHIEEYTDEDVSAIHDDVIDLTETVRDAIILDQPVVELCTPDCLGLCPVCGADLNEDPDHSHPEAVDSRWLGLAEWGKMS